MTKPSGGGVNFPSPWDFKLGGDASPILTDSDVGIAITGDDTKPVAVHSKVDPLTLTSNILGNDANPVAVHLKIDPLEVSSDSTSEIDVKPLKSEIDVKPLAIDSCQTIKLAPLPPICMGQPYSQHFGVTFMGIELWGFNTSGKTEMFLHSPPKQGHFNMDVGKAHDCGEPSHGQTSASARQRSGLHVRVK